MPERYGGGAWASERPSEVSGKDWRSMLKVDPPPGGYRLLVLVGIPGSGKSTFASFLTGMGWVVVNQDSLGSRRTCEMRALALLRRGERVVVDRCNFDPSQRCHWINLAVEMSLHENACAAVWLDVPVEVCQHRVRNRVGHPTLGGPSAASVVRSFSNNLKPPHRAEGFHLILRCRGDHDLSEAVSLLSEPGTNNADDARANGKRTVVPQAAGGGGSGDRAGAFGRAPLPQLPPQVAATGPNHFRGGVGSPSQWNASPDQNPTAHNPPLQRAWADQAGAFGRAPPRQLPPQVATTGPGHSGGSVGSHSQWNASPVQNSTAHNPPLQGTWAACGGGGDDIPGAWWGMGAAGRSTMREGHTGDNTGSTWVGGNGGASAHRSNGNGVVGNNGRHPADSSTATWQPPPAPPPPPPPPPPSAVCPPDLSSRAPTSSGYEYTGYEAGREFHTDHRTAAWAQAEFSPPPNFPPMSGAARAQTNNGWYVPARSNNTHGEIASLPASMMYASRGQGGNVRAWADGQHAGEGGTGGGGVAGAEGAQAATGAWMGEKADDPGLELSEGEAFALLEDMFGGLLPPEALEEAFARSGENLVEAVKHGFQVCEELWAEPEVRPALVSEGPIETPADFPSSLSSATLSDCATTTAAEDWGSACSRSASGGGESGLSSISGGFDAQSWEESEVGCDVPDLSEWTPEQVDALTELSIAFGGEVEREQIIAALVASDMDPLSAAQVLLETEDIEEDAQNGQHQQPARNTSGGGGGVGGKRRRNKKAARNLRFRGMQPPSQQQQQQQQQQQHVTATGTRLGSTCADAARERYGGTWGAGAAEDGEDGVAVDEGEEEEGDEGLTSEEYRARADAAAAHMKVWFQKAAGAFTRGGRNGGAAAAHPSEVGQKWKREMEALNLRAARETFRERNPYIRVGPAIDKRSVLHGKTKKKKKKVLALPRPSQCPIAGRLSVDLHLLRRAEAISVVEAILAACNRHRQSKATTSTSEPKGPGKEGPESIRARTGNNWTSVTSRGGNKEPEGGIRECSDSGGGMEAFSSLEIVVGRGAHSNHGVARLRPLITAYLTRKGFRTRPVPGEKGEGVIVVDLRPGVSA